MIGKWHLGLSYTTKDGQPAASGADKMSNVDFSKPIADGPTARGFDHYFGVNVPNYPPFCFIENDRTVGIPSVRDGGAADGINMPGPMLPGWKLVDILPELTRRTERWIADAGKAAKTGKPFFLYLPLTSPHFPVVPAPEFKGKSQAGDYGDFVVQTDDYVGRVLAALEQAGVADNTLVIFTSDNGPETAGEVNPGAYERIQKHQHASMGELRGVKRDLWEGGHRVPFLARWPGKIPAATVSDETICHVDFMATIAALLDAKLPAERRRRQLQSPARAARRKARAAPCAKPPCITASAAGLPSGRATGCSSSKAPATTIAPPPPNPPGGKRSAATRRTKAKASSTTSAPTPRRKPTSTPPNPPA